MNDDIVIIHKGPAPLGQTFNAKGAFAFFLKHFLDAIRYGLDLPFGFRAAYKKIIRNSRELFDIEYYDLFSLFIEGKARDLQCFLLWFQSNRSPFVLKLRDFYFKRSAPWLLRQGRILFVEAAAHYVFDHRLRQKVSDRRTFFNPPPYI